MATTVFWQSAHVEANAQEAVDARASVGLVPWTGPLVVLAARPLLLIVGQALVALLLRARHKASPWHEAGHWWTVYGTLVDIGCLLAMKHYTRAEGIRLRDLAGPIRLRFGRDLFLGLGYFCLVFPLFVLSGALSHRLLYGPAGIDPGAYLFLPHAMPLWSVVYSLTAWWFIWSPTEEATYQGFALPRVRALTGRTWLAFLIVGFVWAFQHCLLGAIPDARYMLFRTLAFTPGAFAMMAIYWRTRRLAPLIVAHWPMDIAGALMNTLVHFG